MRTITLLTIVTMLIGASGFVVGEEVTKLVAGKPKIEAPAITIPEIDALRLKAAQQSQTIDQYQLNEYWKVVQAIQERMKKNGEVVQSLTVKVFTDAKVDRKDYRISDDGLRLEKIAGAIAKSEGGGK